MAHYPRCRVLAIIGSGETSPTMVTVHRDLVGRLGLSSPQATVLATPYAFQENAADVYRFIYAKVGNRQTAEDLTSAVFLKAVRWLAVDRSGDSVRA